MKSSIVIAWIVAGASVAIAVMAMIGTGEAPRDRAPPDGRRIGELERSIESVLDDVAQLRRELARRGESSFTTPGVEPGSAVPRGSDSQRGSEFVRSEPAVLAALKPEEREKVRELRSLVGKFFSNKATKAETKRFWKLSKSGKMLDMAIASAAADVEANPQSVDARMGLAEVNVAKLYTLPRGAERRLWADQAQDQYRAILAMDENHWEARNGLATGYFHSPKNLNKTADAVREFERLRTVQERGAVEKKQAAVYVNLAVLYRRVGNEAKAREVLEAGQRRHPDDEEIGKTLGLLQK